ncbi:MAG: ribosome small subunit-dependent GTPase A [Myxococcota bacterium]|nr:ribosome small subunit-dependent GTPase A [Myxococcota bacterium]
MNERERGIVLRSTAGFFRVRMASGELVECRMRGRLKKERASTDLAVIGDEVDIERTGAGTGVIAEVKPRRTRFSRLHPTSRGRAIEDVLVANLDQVLVVFAASLPRMNPRLVDRFLVIAEHNRVDALIVATKMDEPEAADARERYGMYEKIGYPVLYTSARTGEGIDALRAVLGGKISALTGPSGGGKSSLLNAVQPGLALAVGEIGDLVRKGRHTTRVAELHPVVASAAQSVHGGFVADTPGIRELASFEIPSRDLASCFPDLRPFVRDCAFGDCLHDREPQCGVRQAMQRGDVLPERYDSYLRQLHGEDR